MKTVDFLRSATLNYGGKQQEIQQIIVFFFKVVISVKSGHCEFSPLTPKKKKQLRHCGRAPSIQNGSSDNVTVLRARQSCYDCARTTTLTASTEAVSDGY